MNRYTYTTRSVTVPLRIGLQTVTACTASLGGLAEYFARPSKASCAMGPGVKVTSPARVRTKQSRAIVAAQKHNAARVRYLVLATKTGGRPSEGDPVYRLPSDGAPAWLSCGNDFAKLNLVGRLTQRANGRTGPWVLGYPTPQMWREHANRIHD